MKSIQIFSFSILFFLSFPLNANTSILKSHLSDFTGGVDQVELKNEQNEQCKIMTNLNTIGLPQVTLSTCIEAVWTPGGKPYRRCIATHFIETAPARCHILDDNLGAFCKPYDCETHGCSEEYRSFKIDNEKIIVNGYSCSK